MRIILVDHRRKTDLFPDRQKILQLRAKCLGDVDCGKTVYLFVELVPFSFRGEVLDQVPEAFAGENR